MDELCQISELSERPILVHKELTKINEKLVVWTNKTSASFDTRGEFTVVVGPSNPPAGAPDVADADLASRFRELSGQLPGATRRDLVVRLAADLGLSRGSVYSALERAKRVEAAEGTRP